MPDRVYQHHRQDEVPQSTEVSYTEGIPDRVDQHHRQDEVPQSTEVSSTEGMPDSPPTS